MKIIVAGAGIGGLTAAYLLAKQGFGVSVYEKQAEELMGYDWADCIEKGIFERIGVSYPEADKLPVLKRLSYFSPSKRVRLDEPDREKTGLVCIERKDLAGFMIRLCRDAGVSFYFGSVVGEAVISGDSVKGIKVTTDGVEEAVRGDLVIDACGMDSPVRRSLPDSFGIEKEILPADTFYVYRGYHHRKEHKEYNPPYRMYFFHNGRCGLDWVISEEDYYDVLAGCFGGITESIISGSISDFISEYHDMEEKPFRGGSVEKIPVRCALPVFVCNGYAAAGDSASMVEPLSGSGIGLSIRAGKLLAETVTENKKNCSDAAVLWKYNEKYHSFHGFNKLDSDNIRRTLCSLTAAELDYLFDKGILTESEVVGMQAHYSAPGLIKKAALILRRRNIAKAMGRFLARSSAAKKIRQSIPKDYSPGKVSLWAGSYSRFYR